MQRRTFALGAAWALMSQGALAQKKSGKSVAAAPAAGRLLQMQPMAPTQPSETHSALALSTRAFGGTGVPYRFSGRMRTVRQLRTGSAPNAWEVAWVFWNF
jgi:hypothetical protein